MHRPPLPRLTLPRLTLPFPLTILRYRRVLALPDPLFPEHLDGQRFERQLRSLACWWRVLPLDQALALLAERRLPARAACITFDHGYTSHADVALPLLQRHGLRATFFVASGLLNGACLWADAVIAMVRAAPGDRLNLGRSGFGSYDIACIQRRRAVIDMLLAALRMLPPDERALRVRAMTRPGAPAMLGPDQVLALHRAGMQVGAHSASQAALAQLSNADARAQIASCREALEEITQAPVRLFAYPGGTPGRDFEQRHASMLRAQGFMAALGAAPGTAGLSSDPYALPRFTPGNSRGALLLAMARNLLAPA